MRTQTVRIGEADHDALSNLSKRTGKPMAILLGEAIHDLQRRDLLQRTNEAYSRLKSDPAAWKEEILERTFWDNTLTDIHD